MELTEDKVAIILARMKLAREALCTHCGTWAPFSPKTWWIYNKEFVSFHIGPCCWEKLSAAEQEELHNKYTSAQRTHKHTPLYEDTSEWT